ncbi:hypothetical protein GSI_03498 [Ganoderma sinense ZZ0214-1]|uniref:Uncharacterized protein n=1 Tax=Ganoderma sinense ZZ0214-1 TaxID=1077348 RepID=A0A2G8SLR5_9APHY|nr:hypothetical protein GSI_03498 [Ganoderma sinense ZZ0214-1]
MAHLNRLPRWQRGELDAVVKVLEDYSPGTGFLEYPWTPQWIPIHGCKTSKMGGYKLASRWDSAPGGALWVGIGISTAGKTMHVPPVVQVSFAQVPTNRDLAAALRQAIQDAS